MSDRVRQASASAGLMGRSCNRIDAADKATGAALYGADYIPREGDLFVTVVRSEEPHAEIVSIDTSQASRIEGVCGAYTHNDVPGTNRHGLIRRDHPVLAEDKVRYRGDAIAVVVAESERIAEQARRAVKVEYRSLPVIGDIDAALADGAPAIHPEGNVMGVKRIRKGDADTASDETDVVVTETFETSTTDHAFLDLEAGTARWDGERLTIRVSGQWVHEEARFVALALGLPVEQVRIIQPATGGAFGGREDISVQIYLGLAALKHPGKTMCIRYSRAESMRARHKRHPMRIAYTLGAKRTGELTTATIVIHSDEGAYASTGVAVMRKAASHATGPYRVPNVSVDVHGVHTNNNPTGAMRGFGATQIAIAYEGMLDRLADALGMDRVELRRKNLIRPGDSVTTGQRIVHPTAIECLEAALEKFHDRPYPDEPLPAHLRRGWGMSVICFGLGYGDGFPGSSRARVAFDDEGNLTVYTGGIDFGQGLLNMVAQVAGQELGLELDQIRVVSADTLLTQEAGPSSATRQTYFTGNAVRIAASELREQILDIAGRRLEVHPLEISLGDGCAWVTPEPSKRIAVVELIREGRSRGYSLEASALFKPRTIREDPSTGQTAKAFVTYLFGSHVSQVLVDVETGEVKVERHIGCHDVGRCVNPQSVRGQIAGGVAQALGMVLMEEVVMRDGRMLNLGLTDYIVPTVHDVPPVEPVILEIDDPGGPFGAHGVGEPTLIAAVPALLSAIRNATGAAANRVPCTPEQVWRMLRDGTQRHGDRGDR